MPRPQRPKTAKTRRRGSGENTLDNNGTSRPDSSNSQDQSLEVSLDNAEPEKSSPSITANPSQNMDTDDPKDHYVEEVPDSKSHSMQLSEPLSSHLRIDQVKIDQGKERLNTENQDCKPARESNLIIIKEGDEILAHKDLDPPRSLFEALRRKKCPPSKLELEAEAAANAKKKENDPYGCGYNPDNMWRNPWNIAPRASAHKVTFAGRATPQSNISLEMCRDRPRYQKLLNTARRSSTLSDLDRLVVGPDASAVGKTFCGNIDVVRNNNPIHEREIRIYMSSGAHRDHQLEMETLEKDAIPYLNEFCSELGCTLSIVSLSWKYDSPIIDDHYIAEICAMEQRSCLLTSKGPSFVALLGGKLGPSSVPRCVESIDFEVVLKSHEEQSNSEALSILKKWYILDENIKPPSYVLQPISTHFPAFISTSEPERVPAKQAWDSESLQILSALRCGAAELSEERRDIFYLNQTELEIEQGIISNPRASSNGFAFIRSFINVDENDDAVADFLENDNSDRSEVLAMIKNDVRSALSQDSVCELEVNWISPRGLTVNTHGKYLKTFNDRFCSMVVKSAMALSARPGIDDPLHREIVHHTRKMIFFLDQKDWFGLNEIPTDIVDKYITITKSNYEALIASLSPPSTSNDDEILFDSTDIEKERMATSLIPRPEIGEQRPKSRSGEDLDNDYISESNTKCVPAIAPLVIHGDKGAGKTWTMCQIAHRIHRHVSSRGMDPVVITRILGSTRESRTARSVLHSICCQIVRAYGVSYKGTVAFDPATTEILPWTKMVSVYRGCLGMASIDRPLFIILDGIDELTNADDALVDLTWLEPTSPLPMHCHIILSVRNGIVLDSLKNLPGLSENPKNLVSIEVPDETHARLALESNLSSQNRRLSHHQMDAVIHCEASKTPLFLLATSTVVRKWSSYDRKGPTTVRFQHGAKRGTTGILQLLFKTMEEKYGYAVVSHCLSILALARNGLHEIEIEDLLSSNEAAMLEAEVWKCGNNLRFPKMLWLRVKSDLRGLLISQPCSEDMSLGTYTFVHKDVSDAIIERYMSSVKSRATVHRALAYYFSDLSPPNIKCVAQPLYHSMNNQPNLRRLTEQPYHVTKLEDEEWSSNILSDNKFVVAKMRAGLSKELLRDFGLHEEIFGKLSTGLKFAKAVTRIGSMNGGLPQVSSHGSMDFGNVAMVAMHQKRHDEAILTHALR
eukprot:UC4_evm3s22